MSVVERVYPILMMNEATWCKKEMASLRAWAKTERKQLDLHRDNMGRRLNSDELVIFDPVTGHKRRL